MFIEIGTQINEWKTPLTQSGHWKANVYSKSAQTLQLILQPQGFLPEEGYADLDCSCDLSCLCSRATWWAEQAASARHESCRVNPGGNQHISSLAWLHGVHLMLLLVISRASPRPNLHTHKLMVLRIFIPINGHALVIHENWNFFTLILGLNPTQMGSDAVWLQAWETPQLPSPDSQRSQGKGWKPNGFPLRHREILAKFVFINKENCSQHKYSIVIEIWAVVSAVTWECNATRPYSTEFPPGGWQII